MGEGPLQPATVNNGDPQGADAHLVDNDNVVFEADADSLAGGLKKGMEWGLDERR